MLAFTWRNCKLLDSSESASVFQPCNTHAFKNSLCWANAAIFQCCPSRNSYRYCTETMKRRLIDWHDISRSAHETEKPWSISTSASLLWLPVTAAVAVSPGSKLPQLSFQRPHTERTGGIFLETLWNRDSSLTGLHFHHGLERSISQMSHVLPPKTYQGPCQMFNLGALWGSRDQEVFSSTCWKILECRPNSFKA